GASGVKQGLVRNRCSTRIEVQSTASDQVQNGGLRVSRIQLASRLTEQGSQGYRLVLKPSLDAFQKPWLDRHPPEASQQPHVSQQRTTKQLPLVEDVKSMAALAAQSPRDGELSLHQ